jgi:hypothetical protein
MILDNNENRESSFFCPGSAFLRMSKLFTEEKKLAKENNFKLWEKFANTFFVETLESNISVLEEGRVSHSCGKIKLN